MRLANTSARSAETASATGVGIVGEIGLEWPLEGTWFFDLAVRGYAVPAIEAAHGSSPSTMLRIRPTHSVLVMGLGVRP
ncbi:MAG: hypothetical protein WEG36_14370 [Gemmatimonadota bacterium]